MLKYLVCIVLLVISLEGFGQQLALEKDFTIGAKANEGLLYKSGVTEYEANKFEASVKELDAAIAVKGDFVEAFVIRAMSKLKLKDTLGAIEDVLTASKLRAGIEHDLFELAGSQPILLAMVQQGKATDEILQLVEKKGQEAFNRGNENMKQGKMKEALVALDQAALYYPKGAPIYISRGAVKYYLKIYKGALADYKKAIEIDSNAASAYLNRAIIEVDLEAYDAAIVDCNELIKRIPNDFQAYLLRGTSYTGLKKYKEAIQDFDKVIGMNPNHADSYLSRAVAKLQMEDYEGAVADCDATLRLNPGSGDAFYYRGTAHQKAGNWLGAKEDFTIVLNIRPNFSILYIDRAITNFNLKDTVAAISDLVDALQWDSTGTNIIKETKLPAEVIAQAVAEYDDYLKALKNLPKKAQHMFLEGRAKYGNGQDEQAITILSKAIEVAPDYIESYYYLGKAYLAAGMASEAVENYSKMIELQPQNFEGYVGRSAAKSFQQDLRGALKDLDKAVYLRPQDINLRGIRAYANFLAKNYVAAIPDYDLVLAINKNDGQALYNRGYARYFTSDKAGACADWGRAIELKVENAASMSRIYCD